MSSDYCQGLTIAASLLEKHFTNGKGAWTSCRAKRCYDELREMMEGK